MATAQTNAPESAWLNDSDRAVFDNARIALNAVKRTFENWTVIGAGVVRAREIANVRGGRKTFQNLLEQQGLGEIYNRKGGKATISHLERIMAQLPEVEAWRKNEHVMQKTGKWKTLTKEQQFDWAAPNTVFKQCPLLQKGKNDDERRPAARERVDLRTERDMWKAKAERLERDGGNLFSGASSPREVLDVVYHTLSEPKFAKFVTLAIERAERQNIMSRDAVKKAKADARTRIIAGRE